MDTENYSVLMSVYIKEKPEYLRQSMQSMFDQTVPTNDFVLVCDGELSDELNETISDFEQKYPNILNVIRLDENRGLGYALNRGIKYCKNELVARMDSDDISRNDRCERQLRLYADHPDISVISGTIEEFIGNSNNLVSRRILPRTNEEILRFAKQRTPFNHMCAMYKLSEVEKAGGYKSLYYLEDYYLWIRMLLNGAVGYNIQEPLVWVRVDNGMYKRRGGLRYIRSQKELFRYMRDRDFINSAEYISAIIKRSVISIMPSLLRKATYKILLRKSPR